MSRNLKGRFEKLEGGPSGPEDAHEREKWRTRIRAAAEQSIDRSRREGKESVFEITENGDVLCTYDGRPVTTWNQTVAEEWYWQHLAWGIRGYDEKAEAF